MARAGGTSLVDAATLIKTQAVDGEILTLVKNYATPLLPGLLSGAGALIGGNAGAAIGGVMGVVKLLDGALPKASGEMLSLPDSGGSPLARHGMDQVIAGIENQKKEDIGQITSTFGGM